VGVVEGPREPAGRVLVSAWLASMLLNGVTGVEGVHLHEDHPEQTGVVVGDERVVVVIREPDDAGIAVFLLPLRDDLGRRLARYGGLEEPGELVGEWPWGELSTSSRGRSRTHSSVDAA